MISSLHILGAKKSGGAEKFFIRLLHALSKRGHPVQVILPPNSETEHLLDESIKCHHVKMRSVYDFPSRWKISRLIRQIQPDIVQTWMGRATRLTRLARGKKPIHVARLGGFYNLKGYRHAHAWIGNTLTIKGYLLENGLPKDKVFHISNFAGVAPVAPESDINTLKKQYNIPDNALCIVAMGRLHPNKGFDTLIEAFKKLPGEINGQPLHMCIIGDGPLSAELRSMSSDTQQASHIHWPGWQANPHIWYQIADLFICPSKHEPLGNVILEAWSHSKPVISTATHGGQELIQTNVNGLLTDIDNSDQMQQAILKIFTQDKSITQSIIDNASQTLLERFGEKVILDQYIECYEELIS